MVERGHIVPGPDDAAESLHASPQDYDPLHDYRNYVVTGRDQPLVQVKTVAAMTGRGPDTVRRWIAQGKLPAERRGEAKSDPLWVPQWAAVGLAETRGLKVTREPEPQPHPPENTAPEEARRTLRESELENTLLVLRAAQEHERRARDLAMEALGEMSKAHDLLADALGSVAIADHP